MKAVLVNYNFTPTWLLTSGLDYLIYDRSDSRDWLKDFPQDRIIVTRNIGQVDFDKLTYLYENYDSLPDVFLWGKTNLFKYISEEEWEAVKDNKVFTPLLTQNHRAYADELGELCYYKDGMYYERNSMLYGLPFKYAEHFHIWEKLFGWEHIEFIPFAPGGNYILTKETVHKQPKWLYATMRDMLPHSVEPAEAQCCERSYYLLWK